MPLMTLIALTPFWAFTLLQLLAIIRSDRKSWLRVLYWLLSGGFSLVLVFAYPIHWGIQCLIGGIYGISFFVFWWWKPEFYYRWDQGGRPKAKEE